MTPAAIAAELLAALELSQSTIRVLCSRIDPRTASDGDLAALTMAQRAELVAAAAIAQVTL